MQFDQISGQSVYVVNILYGQGIIRWNLFHDPKFCHVLEQNIKEPLHDEMMNIYNNITCIFNVHKRYK